MKSDKMYYFRHDKNGIFYAEGTIESWGEKDTSSSKMIIDSGFGHMNIYKGGYIWIPNYELYTCKSEVIKELFK